MGKNRYWTKERVIEESKKYKTRSEFSKKSPTAYTMARIFGYMDELFDPNVKVSRKGQNRYWTKERVMEVVKDFDYRSDFCAAYKGAFNAAKEDGYLDDLFKDKPNNGYKNALVMISMNEKKETGKAIYWTKERAIEEGRKYNTRRDFCYASLKAYNIVRREGLLDMIFADKPNNGHIPIVRNYKKTRKWTREKIIEEGRKYNFRYDFRHASPNAHAAAQKYGLLDEIFRDKPNMGYMNPIYAKAKEGSSDGYAYWTKERIVEEGKKYEFRNEFRQANQVAYQAAMLRGYLDEIFESWPHRGYRNKRLAKAKRQAKKPGRCKYWTEKRIYKEVVKYSSVTEFIRKCRGAYRLVDKLQLRPKLKEVFDNYQKTKCTKVS